MNQASCLSLLSNAVLVWNTVRMGEIVARLRAAGETVSDEDLARISPLAYAHVIPNGTYLCDRAPRRSTIAPIPSRRFSQTWGCYPWAGPPRNRKSAGHVPVLSQHPTSDALKYRGVAPTACGHGHAPVSIHNPIILGPTRQI